MKNRQKMENDNILSRKIDEWIEDPKNTILKTGGRIMYKVYEITKETYGDSGISNTDWSDFINSNSHKWEKYIRELWIEYKRLQCEVVR